MKKIIPLLLLVVSCNPQSGDSTSPSGTEVSSTNPIGTTTPSDDTKVESWTEEFMNLVNDHRRSKGLRALIHDEGVAAVAREHSQDMATGKVAFGHSGFSSRCSDAKDALGGGNLCAENVAVGQKTPQDAFTAWMNSSGHRGNIEQSRATHTGLGFFKSLSGKYYWTQIFIEL